ncbi:hypothetical protein [Sorangium sp. So ce385]
MNKKKLTLDDVLLKLQTDQGMKAVTETDKVRGGKAVQVLDGCHKVTA